MNTLVDGTTHGQIACTTDDSCAGNNGVAIDVPIAGSCDTSAGLCYETGWDNARNQAAAWLQKIMIPSRTMARIATLLSSLLGTA